MRYYAHTAELPDGRRDPNPEHWQLLKDHLSHVAALAADFARPFGLHAEANPWATEHHVIPAFLEMAFDQSQPICAN